MFLNNCLLVDQKNYSIDHYNVIFYLYGWSIKLLVTSWIISFSNVKRKYIFNPLKLNQIKKSKYWFCACFVILDRYLFQSSGLLKPDFNGSSSFALSWVDKVTTGTYFVLVILNVGTCFAEVPVTIKQYAD